MLAACVHAGFLLNMIIPVVLYHIIIIFPGNVHLQASSVCI
jgi:hypothetical protein